MLDLQQRGADSHYLQNTSYYSISQSCVLSTDKLWFYKLYINRNTGCIIAHMLVSKTVKFNIKQVYKTCTKTK